MRPLPVNTALAALLLHAADCVDLALNGPIYDCPTCGGVHRPEEVTQREVDEACVLVCRRTGAVVKDLDADLPF